MTTKRTRANGALHPVTSTGSASCFCDESEGSGLGEVSAKVLTEDPKKFTAKLIMAKGIKNR